MQPNIRACPPVVMTTNGFTTYVVAAPTSCCAPEQHDSATRGTLGVMGALASKHERAAEMCQDADAGVEGSLHVHGTRQGSKDTRHAPVS